MTTRELRAKSVADLKKELEELYREQFNLRLQRATGQLAQHDQVPKVRRKIARVLTIMNEKAKTAS